MVFDLETIRKIIVTTSVYQETVDFLQAMGHRESEGMVIWAGKPSSSGDFLVDQAHIPVQVANAWGARVTADEMDRMFERLYQEGRFAMAQVHSHPAEAFHSEIDDEFPILTRHGALSLVVPNYGLGDAADFRSWASYRLGEAGWIELDVTAILTLE